MLDELVTLIGRPGALALCALYGGSRLYVPAEPTATHPLVVLLGDLLVGRLAARYHGAAIEIPRPPIAEARQAEARRLRAEGLTIREIAGALDVNERTVWRLLAD